MAERDEVVLCVNSGSSSLKVALLRGEQELAKGVVERLGTSGATHAQALAAQLASFDAAGLPKPTVAGHRVVHGGSEFSAPALLGPDEIARLRSLVRLAPLHLPAAIACIEALAARDPALPQVACFDTAFHATLPEHARRLPVPDWLHDEGVRRYGFHGLSYEHAVASLGDPPPARVVIAHLGNGSSLAAVRDGRCIDTTMAFTPTAGVIMSSRTGDLDPGVISYLLREKGMSAEAVDTLVNRESGLLALGGASDVRELLQRRSAGDERAQLALHMFVYSVQRAIAGLAVALGGIDTLVFTGGIGEHATELRSEICAGLGVVGVTSAAVLVISADEDRVIARHAARLVSVLQRRGQE